MRLRRNKVPAAPSQPPAVPVRTDAGMLCVWSPGPFADVLSYDAWEVRVNERLSEAIRGGELVPVNIEADGAYGVRVAVAPDSLSDRERPHEVVTSEPYLLVVSGGEACVSGIEGVGDTQYAAIRIPLSDGRYSLQATIVDWEAEPDAHLPDGSPAPTALPDFVLRIARETADSSYRNDVLTFDPIE